MKVTIICAASVFTLALSAAASAPSGRYTTTIDTVVDTKTGLTWQRTVPTGFRSWPDATTYCSGLSLGGFSSGWRLPTVAELASIVDRRAYNPSIDTGAFPLTPAQNFWTSSQATSRNSVVGVYSVSFFTGIVGGAGDISVMTCMVRCVR